MVVVRTVWLRDPATTTSGSLVSQNKLGAGIYRPSSFTVYLGRRRDEPTKVRRTIIPNIKVGRYQDPELRKEWQGWLEPDDHSWIAFITADGKPVFFLDRDPETGAVIVEEE